MTRILLLFILLVGLCDGESLKIEVGPQKEHKTLTSAAIHLAELRESDPEKAVEIEIAPGRYELSEPLTLGPEHSGLPEALVTWRAEGKVEISGAREIRGFTVGEDGLWRVKVPDGLRFEQLWVNGRRAERARFPNIGTIPLLSVTEEKLAKNSSRKLGRISPEFLIPLSGSGTPEGLQVLVYHKWDNTRRFVENMDYAAGTFTTVGEMMKPWNRWDNTSGIVFENAIALLDAPGEWFLENGELTYQPREGENPDRTFATAPMIGSLLNIRGQPGKTTGHMLFKGLNFSGTSWLAPASGFDPEQAAASIGAAIEVTDAEEIVFRDCSITQTANYGIWFRKGSRACRVQNCILKDLGAGGLKASDSRKNVATTKSSGFHRFTDNTILDGGHVFPCAVGVWIGHSADNEISHNEIAHFPYTGISIGWRWGYGESIAKRNKILFNYIHHIGDGELSDMGGIYTLGPSEGTLVSNNYIHDITSKTYGGWGLYTDEGSTGIVMENNLVHDTKSGGFHQHFGTKNMIRNNIFAFGREQQIQFTRPEDHQSFEFTRNIVLWKEGELLEGAWDKGQVLMDYNLYWQIDRSPPLFLDYNLAEWQEEKGRDLHSIVADPGFDKLGGADKWVPTNKEALEKIGFIPFDVSKVGPR